MKLFYVCVNKTEVHACMFDVVRCVKWENKSLLGIQPAALLYQEASADWFLHGQARREPRSAISRIGSTWQWEKPRTHTGETYMRNSSNHEFPCNVKCYLHNIKEKLFNAQIK